MEQNNIVQGTAACWLQQGPRGSAQTLQGSLHAPQGQPVRGLKVERRKRRRRLRGRREREEEEEEKEQEKCMFFVLTKGGLWVWLHLVLYLAIPGVVNCDVLFISMALRYSFHSPIGYTTRRTWACRHSHQFHSGVGAQSWSHSRALVSVWCCGS